MVLMGRTDVVVIGAGISGLTTAVTLAETGLSVGILAERDPTRTNSAKAGASWGPYMVSDDRVLRWSKETFGVLAGIAAGAGTGVRMVPGVEAFEEQVAEPPSWALEVPDFVRGLPPGLPAHYVDGWRYTVPIVDMPVYLKYLSRRFIEAGGTLEIGRAVTGFTDVAADRRTGTILVNCTGAASRYLVPDDSLTAVRGQLVLVDNPGIGEFFQDNPHGSDLTCIFPHEDYVVLGGNASPDVADTAPDPRVAAQILERCREVDPRLNDARVIGHRVGLRPNRPSVRVEWDERTDFPLLHNYGHGGSGVTLSWGCAFEVLELLRSRRPA
ncbi:FAD-dependent oxidoreductase [Phytomonospora endophytica]|uniref:D-amino-acid oxidase n=1 Tax=Phytomonospora endophytica TaxID=714109 RepID=A0A841F5W0_9ACTN|nr:FAD-dependent oxidoreductase [Phytomonospora endophytica]MBB6032311.1 D-amino-acid oxidase [Phytomonospora endophytica]GIG68659.1 amino acid oxidase [Phytomonospora endophytica]